MREAIRDIDRLRHIDECIEHINDYLNGKSFEDMAANIMCYPVPCLSEALDSDANAVGARPAWAVSPAASKCPIPAATEQSV